MASYLPKHCEVSTKSEIWNNDINSKVSFCQGDINIDAIVNATSETLISGSGTYGAIHEATGPGLLQEFQKLNGCETVDCKATLGYKLSVNFLLY